MKLKRITKKAFFNDIRPDLKSLRQSDPIQADVIFQEYRRSAEEKMKIASRFYFPKIL